MSIGKEVVTITWSKGTTNDPLCTAYQAYAPPSPNYTITVSGQTFTIKAPVTATVGTHSVPIQIRLTAATAVYSTVNLSYTITDCIVTGFAYSSGAITT